MLCWLVQIVAETNLLLSNYNTTLQSFKTAALAGAAVYAGCAAASGCIRLDNSTISGFTQKLNTWSKEVTAKGGSTDQVGAMHLTCVWATFRARQK
jgi:hypothetical protein